MINLNKLYDAQLHLDQTVARNKNIDVDNTLIVDDRIFGFHVELMELANEVGWFKYWKQSHKRDKKKSLIELADCIHLALSVALSRKYHLFVREIDPHKYTRESVRDLFQSIRANEMRSTGNYRTLMEQLFALGIKLGFTIGEIETAYYIKNDENLKRQSEGY